jgi:hypothetical protein
MTTPPKNTSAGNLFGEYDVFADIRYAEAEIATFISPSAI